MYWCNDCKDFFEEPNFIREWIGEPNWGGYQEFGRCPLCGEDDYEEVSRCEMCEESYLKPSEDICGNCLESVSQWMNEALMQIQKETGATDKLILDAMFEWIDER